MLLDPAKDGFAVWIKAAVRPKIHRELAAGAFYMDDDKILRLLRENRRMHNGPVYEVAEALE